MNAARALILVLVVSTFCASQDRNFNHIPVTKNAVADTPSIKWVANYNGEENLDDGAVAMVLDDSGNVYITGNSGVNDYFPNSHDLATVKYNSEGEQVWVNRFVSPAHADDLVNDIAIDDSGNIYITSEGIYVNMDLLLIKYSNSGVQKWVRGYDGPGHSTDLGRALVIDDSNNIYVTGSSYNSSLTVDYVTVKFNGNGDSLWVRRYDAGLNDDDHPMAIAIDKQNNIYVTGRSEGPGGCDDFATIKYSSDGDVVWVSRYAGTSIYDAQAEALAVDDSGNVYVTGLNRKENLDYDIATIKYNSEGSEQWISFYDGLYYDAPQKIKLDNLGNFYVIGQSENVNSNRDFVTIKYDCRTGNELWVDRYNAANDTDIPSDIEFDEYGFVYVTGGTVYPGTRADMTIIKYNPSGEQLWTTRFAGSGDSWDSPKAICLDKHGNFYITGGAKVNGTSYDFVTIKYEQTLTSVNQENASDIKLFRLDQNYPNPFNPATTISYELSVSSYVKLNVYNILGQEVAKLVDEVKPGGTYEVTWNAASGSFRMPSGVYIFQLKAGSFIQTKKMMLLR